MPVEIKPLTPDLLDDYLWFFDNMSFKENPDWSVCYCFSFHFTGTSEQWTKEKNRSSVINYVQDHRMTGYLAYSDNRPVGWCNANDRLNYQRLIKYYDLIDNPEEKVCSVVCFLIHPDYRRQGIAQKILDKISQDYAGMGYDYLEAYPGKGDLSCEGHYRGPLPLYEKNGFEIKRELADYYVIRKKLNTPGAP
ncbi:MAG: GNAT family N-acetyltransferase [Bacteroidota bacterium]